MFDVGFSELVVIALVALMVLGPEKLPRAARTVGALVRRARTSWLSLQGELERELGASELKESLRSLKSSADLGAVESELRQVAREATVEIPPASDPAPAGSDAITKPPAGAGETAKPSPTLSGEAAKPSPMMSGEAAPPSPAVPPEHLHE
jgi:sec-independent protein translocase protein TatB